MFRSLILPQWSRIAVINQRVHSSTISTVQQILNYDISDALVNRQDYFQEKKKKGSPTVQRTMLENKFKEYFSFSKDEAAKLVETNRLSWKIPLQKITANIECLHEKKVKAQSIANNLWLLGVPISKSTLK